MLTEQLKLTYDDYVTYPDDGYRHEILEGEHFMVPAPNFYHQKISRDLMFLLWEFVKKNNLGEVAYAPVDVVLSHTNICQPDIVYISNANKSIIKQKNIQGAPDLVIEILSETTEKIDRTKKFKLYHSFGVQEYWIVDPGLKTIEIYLPGDVGYVLSARFAQTETLESPLLPGLGILLKKIF